MYFRWKFLPFKKRIKFPPSIFCSKKNFSENKFYFSWEVFFSLKNICSMKCPFPKIHICIFMAKIEKCIRTIFPTEARSMPYRREGRQLNIVFCLIFWGKLWLVNCSTCKRFNTKHVFMTIPFKQLFWFSKQTLVLLFLSKSICILNKTLEI